VNLLALRGTEGEREVDVDTYSPVSDIAKWRERQSAISKACSDLFDHYVSGECAIFQDCMSMTSDAFEELLMPGVMSTPSQRVAHRIACHAYQLLLSAWDDLRMGRLAASCDHWRSIVEAPDYILAAAFNPDFAHAWADLGRKTTVKVENARRIVRDEMERRKAGEGARWARRRGDADRKLQRFSHVTVEVALLTFLPGPEGAFAVPEGAYRPEVKRTARYMAVLAGEVMATVSVAFYHSLSADWKARFVEAFYKRRSALSARGLG